ncbi:MAG: hypothetical protein DRP08_01855 [Candidatus Aenigmatarchaeota archaeon]|nr:MAG: hypothetical protein DRP08_01855 [Candidatus Aenigmarchaeota archaeon]
MTYKFYGENYLKLFILPTFKAFGLLTHNLLYSFINLYLILYVSKNIYLNKIYFYAQLAVAKTTLAKNGKIRHHTKIYSSSKRIIKIVKN